MNGIFCCPNGTFQRRHFAEPLQVEHEVADAFRPATPVLKVGPVSVNNFHFAVFQQPVLDFDRQRVQCAVNPSFPSRPCFLVSNHGFVDFRLAVVTILPLDSVQRRNTHRFNFVNGEADYRTDDTPERH